MLLSFLNFDTSQRPGRPMHRASCSSWMTIREVRAPMQDMAINGWSLARGARGRQGPAALVDRAHGAAATAAALRLVAVTT
jgi:hypothetical protein